MTYDVIDAALWAQMMRTGAAALYKNKQTINDLNVFPIPDGDTGDNMYMTIKAGVIEPVPGEALGVLAGRMAEKNLYGARGNSGVILSRFLYGVSAAMQGYESADTTLMIKAFDNGVKEAYRAVSQPKEGTILTVLREACEKTQDARDLSTFFDNFIKEGNLSLRRTPDLLPVLKEAGVVDSGGAGLLLIVGGMYAALKGEPADSVIPDAAANAPVIDLDKFQSNSELIFGYCTELLIRLQDKKVDVENYDVGELIAFLESVGESVVAFRTGSIVKLHVHTMTPEKVLAYCHTLGEFLTVKIENMMLEHHEVKNGSDLSEYTVERAEKEYAVIACCCGEGLKQTFLDLGVDEVVSGGQSMNPSTALFLDAIRKVNAKTVFILPNNPNIVLAAEQAKELSGACDVRVIESVSIGEGLAAVSMADLVPGDPDAAEASLREGMAGVLTAQISKCVRDAQIGDQKLEKDDFIGFVGKDILASGGERLEIAEKTLDGMHIPEHDIFMIIRGKDCDEKEAGELSAYARRKYPSSEIYDMDGGQDIYDYILVAQ